MNNDSGTVPRVCAFTGRRHSLVFVKMIFRPGMSEKKVMNEYKESGRIPGRAENRSK